MALLAYQAMALMFFLTTQDQLATLRKMYIPVWVLVIAGILLLVFGILMIISPRGSNKRRGKRRTIL
jgi:hypothetical protein